MKYLVLCAAVLATPVNVAVAKALDGQHLASRSYDCASFHSANDMRMTSGARKACADRYLQLRMLEERNDKLGKEEEPKKEEQIGFELLPAFVAA